MERKFKVIKDRTFNVGLGKRIFKKDEIYTEIELFGDLISNKSQSGLRDYRKTGKIDFRIGITQFLKYFKEVENE